MYNRRLLLLRISTFCVLNIEHSFAQAPFIEWQNTIGGSNSEFLYSVHQTTDGGYILGGNSNSGISGDKIETGSGGQDCWVIKLNEIGEIEWQNTLGGDLTEYLYAIHPTSDGGCILGGTSNSNIFGDKTDPSKGGLDYWIVKLNSSGSIEWQNTIGGDSDDHLISIQQTNDGGYIFGGYTLSGNSGDKLEPSFGDFDYWVVKTNATGEIEWQNAIGGNNADMLYVIQQTTDGGYIVGGYSNSGISGEKTEASLGQDYWVVRLNTIGEIEWQNTIGGGSTDFLYAIQPTTDGGYILGGQSFSNISGDKTETSLGGNDYWIVKLNNTGTIDWQNTIGGSGLDNLFSIQQTADGGYILGGHSDSGITGDKTQASMGGYDYWVIKLNNSGYIEWQSTIGGSSNDFLISIDQTTDGGYVLGGYSFSGLSGDKTESSLGSNDYWVIKLDDILMPIENLSFYGYYNNLENVLHWEISAEFSYDYFEIQKSLDGVNFYKIGSTENSNYSPTKENYMFLDNDPLPDNNYYRLRIVDFHGQFRYSNLIDVVVSENIADNLSLYPNPTNNIITIEAYHDGIKTFYLANALGETLQTIRTEKNSISINLNTISSGVYFIKMENSVNSQAQMFVKK